MRGKGAIVACVGVALLAAGCGSLDGTYLREGVGTTLGSTDLPEASNLQDIYVGEICRQAGLRVVAVPGAVPYCEEVGMRPSEWSTFVQAGLNDIDRRCDAYLAWLDNKRRWREPILKQLHTTAAATAAIMGLVGSGAVPIAVVATAFGFSQDTFVNFNSRLITEVNQSVVQAVVLDNQNEFRRKIASVPVDNRPAAIYLLRNYLRICMPFSIEMSINNTMTTYHRGGPEALARNEPLLTRGPGVAGATARAAPLRARVALAPTTAPRRPAPGAVTAPEASEDEEDVRKLQALICVPPDGTFGPSTRVGIRVLQQALGSPNPTGELGKRDLRVVLQRIATLGACNTAQHRNYYERTILSTPADVTQLQKELNSWQLGPSIPESGIMDAVTRQKIMAVREAMTALRESPEVSNQVTPAFRLAVRRPPAR